MNCQRCQRDEALYRLYTDRMAFKVCIGCAFKAQQLGIADEVLPKNCNPDHRPGNTQLEGLGDPCVLREDPSLRFTSHW